MSWLVYGSVHLSRLFLLTLRQNNTTKTSGQDVSPELPTIVNGNVEKYENKQDTEHDEPNINSAEVSISGGSDTEASKAETSKAQGDEKGHARSTSTVKKFTSFKPVSVNKTFLAAKGATTASPLKLGDKTVSGSSSMQTGSLASSAPRPRLVAKSGSGLRDSAPRSSSTANGGKSGAAPDASAVWNKNRRTLHFWFLFDCGCLTILTIDSCAAS